MIELFFFLPVSTLIKADWHWLHSNNKPFEIVRLVSSFGGDKFFHAPFNVIENKPKENVFQKFECNFNLFFFEIYALISDEHKQFEMVFDNDGVAGAAVVYVDGWTRFTKKK